MGVIMTKKGLGSRKREELMGFCTNEVLRTLGIDLSDSGQYQKYLNTLDKYVKQNNFDLKSKVDAKDIAKQYLRARVENTRVNPEKSEKEISMDVSNQGFIQNIVTFAALQPLVLRFRKEILGTFEPINWHEMDSWLEKEERESSQEEKYRLRDVHFQFVVPEDFHPKVPEEVNSFDKAAVKAYWREAFSQYLDQHLDSMPLPNSSGSGSKFPYYSWFDGVQNHVIDMKTGKLLKLYMRAKELEAICPILDYRLYIGLILHGNMYHLRLNIEEKPTAFDSAWFLGYKFGDIPPNEKESRNRNYWKLLYRYSLPMPSYTLPTLEYSPDQVAEIHREVLKDFNLSDHRGRPMNKETEVLAIAAIQLVWLGVIRWKGKLKYTTIEDGRSGPLMEKGFPVVQDSISGFGKDDLAKIREQYRRIASFYNLDPNYFHFRKKDVTLDSLRKALEGLNKTYYQMMEKLDNSLIEGSGMVNNKISLFQVF